MGESEKKKETKQYHLARVQLGFASMLTSGMGEEPNDSRKMNGETRLPDRTMPQADAGAGGGAEGAGAASAGVSVDEAVSTP